MAPARPVSPNQLLSALPPDEYERIQLLLKPMPLPFHHALHRRGEPVQAAYFPGDGVISITNTMRDGGAIEVATVGREGLVGLSAFFGSDSAACDATVIVPDTSAQAIGTDHFRAELARRGPLFDLVSRYADAFLAAVIQTAACNSLHSVEQRSCRWLLLTHDRLDRDEFSLTHDAIAMLLGVRRPTISLVILDLERAGLVRHRRGRIAITDRPGLEAAACECYRVIRQHLDHVHS